MGDIQKWGWHLTLVRAVSSHEPGRAELLLRPDIGAVRQHRPTNKRWPSPQPGPIREQAHELALRLE
jgi:hypothetical protein